MATFTWTGTATSLAGDWASTADWSPAAGAPPGGTSKHTDVATLGPLGSGSAYTVTISSAELFDVSGLNIGATNGAHNPGLSIVGGAKGSATLLVDTLNYTTAAAGPASVISLGIGGVLDIRTAITDAGKAQTISISASGQGGSGSGGHLEFGSLTVDDPNVTYDFRNNSANGNNTGAIEFQSGFATGSTTNQHIKDVGNLDEFIIDGANFTGDTVAFDKSTGTLTVKNGAATVFTMKNVALQSGFTGAFVASGDVIQAVCYARGTLLRTPDGELPVERLRLGRQVITLVEGQHVPRPVTWLGHRRITLTNHPRPETVAPIRIRKDAFADGVPRRDLVVSPDHAIFIQGTLICARQLVNGSTIRQEFDWTAVDYYHVELERHAILLAEGLPAESYIDTGNSSFFANSGAPLVLHPDLTDQSDYPTREAGSCAPFVWDEASVRPVWQRLAERAATLGRPAPQRGTTTDPMARLRAKGRTVKPIYAERDLVVFTLPRGVREVRLLSRAQPPTEARPWLEDRRTLGLRVSRIVLRSAHDLREIPVDHPELTQGWWAVERDGQLLSRWTDGDAIVPLPTLQGDAMLEIHLAGTMIYTADEVAATEAEHRAA
jgi:hypothetical protein